mgnify:FL=1
MHLLENPEFQYQPFEIGQMIPSACQGIIAIESRKNDGFNSILQAVTDTETKYCFETERHILALLGGDCSIPVSALAQIEGNQIRLAITKDCQKIQTGTAPIEERFRLAEELTAKL